MFCQTHLSNGRFSVRYQNNDVFLAYFNHEKEDDNFVCRKNFRNFALVK